MKLTFSPASPFARKVRIAAIELGLIDTIEFVPTTVAPGQPNEEYSRITPLKKLPVLILDNGEVILDSYVIVEYLDELAGGGKLIPASGAARWKVKSEHSMLQGMLKVGAMKLKFTVGDLTIHRIIEQETTFLPALDLLPALTPDLLAENRPWMREAGAIDAEGVLILCFQSYIVKTPHHTILVDSCIGNDKPRPLRPQWNMKTDGTYMRALASAGFSVDEIDYVMCTHLHVDHVGWNTRLEGDRWVPTFPNARYIFAKEEFDYWTEQHAKTPVPPFADSVLRIVQTDKAEIVRDDYAIGDHVRILPTPGHTPGHVAFAFGRGKDDAVISGDLMHSPLQARYPELSMKFDVDQALAATTRRNFLERYCDTDTLCCTAHFPSPSSGKVGRWGNGFSCEAVTAK